MKTTKQTGYGPILFIAITFGITWILAVFHAYQTWFSSDTIPGTIILIIANFFSSASPLVAAIILLRKSLFKGHNLTRFVFGVKPILLSYIIVAALFLFQFLTFFFFRFENNTISINAFIAAWCGQILLGGGMEEGGWRGYLQPAIEQKVHIIITVIIAGLVWALWHRHIPSDSAWRGTGKGLHPGRRYRFGGQYLIFFPVCPPATFPFLAEASRQSLSLKSLLTSAVGSVYMFLSGFLYVPIPLPQNSLDSTGVRPKAFA